MWQYNSFYDSPIQHHGILGQKWGIRRYQNEDGTLTPEGKARLENYKSQQLAKVKNDRYSEHKKAAIEAMTYDQMTYEKRQQLLKNIAKGLEVGSAIAAPILGATVVAPWMSAKALELFSDPEVRSKITGLLTDFMKSDAAQTAISDISSDAIKIGTEVMNSPEMRRAAEQIITENIITERKLVERRG